MALIQDKDRKVVQDRLKDMVSPVRLALFTQEQECQFCRETRQLMTELVELSDTLTLDVYNFQIDAEPVKRYGVDKVPAIAVEGSSDFGIRYYGIPGGYEFGSLLETIQAVSKGDSGLAPENRAKLALLRDPVHIQVFVTPT
jgi:glutaredoxin-like protein